MRQPPGVTLPSITWLYAMPPDTESTWPVT